MPSFELLSEPIRQALAWPEPTPIQEKAIPEILSGKNVLAIAPTGTGKTEAALLPLLDLVLKNEKHAPISVIYITPLRALNRDLLGRIESFCAKLGLSVSVRHGDTSQKERAQQLKRPPDVLITTPETLGSLLSSPRFCKHLENVRHVVVDEVHELVGEKRGCQLALALERLATRAFPAVFQRVGLSATVGDPQLVADFFGLEKIVKADALREIRISVECPRYSKEDVLLSERLHASPEVVARLRRLKQLVDEHGSVLTFVNTRQTAELLASRFEALEKEKKVRIHHSSLAKDVRVVAEREFKDGTVQGLIATSSLELGIDIGRVNFVVQYLSPRQVSRLVQRVGRSGHGIGRVPAGAVVCADAEDVLESAVVVRRALAGELEPVRVFEKPFDVLAQQLAGMALESGSVRVSRAFEVVKKAFPFRNLSIDELFSVLKQLAAQRILWLERGEFGKNKQTYLYYFSNLSMISDEAKFFIIDAASGKNIAVLDESFVVNNLYAGCVFITRGVPWSVLDIHEREVIVEPAYDISGEIPAWEGEQIPVPFGVAQEVGALRKQIVSRDFSAEKYCLDPNAFSEARHLAKKQADFFIPDEKTVWIETVENFLVVYAHFGSLINEALGKIISLLASASLGETVAVKTDPYRIVLKFADRSNSPRAGAELVKKILLETKPGEVLPLLEKSLLRTQLFKYRFIHVARRFGLIEKHADYQRISVRRLVDAVIDSPIYKETLNEIFVEKIDLENTRLVLSKIQSGEFKIHAHAGAVSPLSQYSLHKLMQIPELVMPSRPEAEIIDIMRERVFNKRAKFVCSFCKNIFYELVKNLPEKIVCPACSSAMVVFLKSDEDPKLFEKDAKRQREFEQIATLVSTYGKRAVVVLSGRGVGPEQATRILGRMRQSEKDLFRDMLAAQKEFLRTKTYWS